MLTDSRLLYSLRLRARVTIKRELMRLCRAHDAAAAFLWTATPTGDKAYGIEHAGRREALPRSPNMLGGTTHVCEQRTLRSIGGDELEVVLLYSRMCNDAPVLLLGLVDAAEPFTDVLTDDLERTLDDLEMVILDVLDPEPTPERPRVARGKLGSADLS
jgi:hypothetical protein